MTLAVCSIKNTSSGLLGNCSRPSNWGPCEAQLLLFAALCRPVHAALYLMQLQMHLLLLSSQCLLESKSQEYARTKSNLSLTHTKVSKSDNNIHARVMLGSCIPYRTQEAKAGWSLMATGCSHLLHMAALNSPALPSFCFNPAFPQKL